MAAGLANTCVKLTMSSRQFPVVDPEQLLALCTDWCVSLRIADMVEPSVVRALSAVAARTVCGGLEICEDSRTVARGAAAVLRRPRREERS
jgi:hypothetical protein